MARHVRSFTTALLMALLLLSTALQAAPAQAQEPSEADKARAKEHFQAGVAAYGQERYEVALASFQEAFRIAPHPLVRVNMANCYDKLGKPLLAIFHFERFMQSKAGSPEQRKEVRSALSRLSKKVGDLSLQVSPDGAVVTIDGGEQRKAPILEPLRLEAGEHRVDVRLEGYQPVSKMVRLHGGEQTELAITLERATQPVAAVATAPATPAAPADPGAQSPAPSGAPAAETPSEAAPLGTEPEPVASVEAEPFAGPAEPPGSRPVPSSVWILGGIGAGLLAAGTITGLLALSAESDFKDKQADLSTANTPIERVVSYNDASDAADRADALALTTDLLLLGAVASGAAALVLYFKRPRQYEDTVQLQLTPELSPQRAGLRLQGAF
ncbi:MAG: PEGA domain-containing protein [Myxococcales bacterium]|nr:PEGA domain-containing protein [Myxococcales bacterium]